MVRWKVLEQYVVAVLDNVGGGVAGGSGCATHLCTVICSSCQAVPLEWGGDVEAIPGLEQAHNKDMRSYVQERNKDTMNYMQAHNNDSRRF